MRDDEPLRDFLVAQSAGHERHDLELARRELLELLGRRAQALRARQEVRHDRAGDARSEHGVAPRDDAHRVHELLRIGVPEEDPTGSGPQRAEDRLIARGTDQHQHGSLPGVPVREDPVRRLQPAPAGEVHVDEHDVGARLAGGGHRLAGRGRLGGDAHAGL
jgi:hypothetical protein